MNPKPTSETDSIRSDIEMTRRRMDDTMDALGERMKGRHLLDEVIGFFRNSEASDKTSEAASKVKEKLSDAAGKISESAGTAASAALDTVKKNPLPILLITAGAAWLAYNATRKRSSDFEAEDMNESDRYDPDTHYDRPLEYPGGTLGQAGSTASDMTDEASSKMSQMKDAVSDKMSAMSDKMSAAKDQMKEKFSDLSDKTRDKFQSVKARASEIGGRVGDKTKQMYGTARDKVSDTADEYPIQVGLGCLALGVLIGLALPTPDPVNRVAGPTVDRLRTRTRDAGREMLQKGKRVVQAASDAAKQEAQSQGLTIEQLRQSASAVGQRAQSAAADEAQDQGLMSNQPGMSGNQRAGAEPADPSAARPAM